MLTDVSQDRADQNLTGLSTWLTALIMSRSFWAASSPVSVRSKEPPIFVNLRFCEPDSVDSQIL